MIPKKYRGYLIVESNDPIKNGKLAIEVTQPAPHGHSVVKKFRYVADDLDSKGEAITLAYAFVETLPFIRRML
jgi:hypothetical protein